MVARAYHKRTAFSVVGLHDALAGLLPSLVVAFIAPSSCRSTTGNALVAGVAAQYLQLHPNASAEVVKQALIEGASPHAVTGLGVEPASRLLFTNYTQPRGSVVAGASANDGGSGGLSAGALAGIVVGVAVGKLAGCCGLALGAVCTQHLDDLACCTSVQL